jgi:hypothetical protein
VSKHITGRRWTRPTERTHPIWCDVVRCLSPYAGTQGEHRSEPIRRHVPGVGVVVATLTQLPGRAVRVDVTLSVPLPTGTGDRRDSLFAEQLLTELANTITRVANRGDAIPSARPSRAIAQ